MMRLPVSGWLALRLKDSRLLTKAKIFRAMVAKPLGARVYAENPAGFAARIEAYWKAWRSEVKVDPIAAGNVGEPMRLIADLNQMHLIDPRTELVI